MPTAVTLLNGEGKETSRSRSQSLRLRGTVMADHPIKHIVVLMFENRKGAPANDWLSSVPEH
jgi:hypothetical protein